MGDQLKAFAERRDGTEVGVVAGQSHGVSDRRIDRPFREPRSAERFSDRVREQRAHLDDLVGGCIQAAQLAVLAKAAGGRVDRAEDVVDGGLRGRQRLRPRDDDADRASERAVVGDAQHADAHCLRSARRSARASTGQSSTAR